MKTFKILVTLLILSDVVLGETIQNRLESYKDNLLNKIDNSKSSFTISVGTTAVDMQSVYQGVDYVEINNDPIYLVNFGLTFFPDTLDLSIGYSTVLDDQNSDTSDVTYTNIFIKPFKTKYGDFGFGYKKINFNTTVTNVGSEPLSFLDVPSDDGMQNIQPNESFTTNTTETRFIFHYNVPNSISYLPNQFGTQLSVFSGNKPWVSSYEHLELAANIEDGVRIDIGINKTSKELVDGFNIKRLGVYTQTFNEEYYNYGMQRDESWGKDGVGYYIDIVYKNRLNIASTKLSYSFSCFLEKYLPNGEEVVIDSGEVDENGETIWIDSDIGKEDETTMGLSFELTYIY